MKKLVLFWQECLAQPFFHLLFFLTMVITIWFSLGFSTLEKTLASYIEEQFVSKLPPKTIRVTPRPLKTIALFGIQLKRPEGSYIDDKMLRKIRQLKGIARIYPFLSSQLPMQVQISIFGLGYQSDVVAIGVPWEFIQSEVPSSYKRRWKTWKQNDPVIALLPASLLDMYNQTLARPNQLPTITEDFAKGQKLNLVFGKSSLKSVGEPLIVQGELAGFSRKIHEIALILPFSVVDYYNKRFGYEQAEYSYVLIEAENHESQLSLSKALTELKLNVSSETTLSQEIVSLQTTLRLVFRFLQILIWGLCTISVGLAAFLSGLRRQSYYQLLRILGESRLFLFVTIAVKYMLLVGISLWVGRHSFLFVLRYLPTSIGDISLKVVSQPEMWLLMIAVGIATLPAISLFSNRPGNRL